MSCKVICHGCDGKGLVNYVKLKSGQMFTENTKTTVQKCLYCKGTRELNNGLVSKN